MNDIKIVYTITYQPFEPTKQNFLRDHLDYMGSDGWELIQIINYVDASQLSLHNQPKPNMILIWSKYEKTDNKLP